MCSDIWYIYGLFVGTEYEFLFNHGTQWGASCPLSPTLLLDLRLVEAGYTFAPFGASNYFEVEWLFTWWGGKTGIPMPFMGSIIARRMRSPRLISNNWMKTSRVDASSLCKVRQYVNDWCKVVHVLKDVYFKRQNVSQYNNVDIIIINVTPPNICNDLQLGQKLYIISPKYGFSIAACHDIP